MGFGVLLITDRRTGGAGVVLGSVGPWVGRRVIQRSEEPDG